MYRSAPHPAAQHAALFAEYHASLGFNATILYERGTYLRRLFRFPETKKLLHKGDLKVWTCYWVRGKTCTSVQPVDVQPLAQLMLWDQGTARAPLWAQQSFWGASKHYVKYDQILIYDHALTALYGMNAYMYLGDSDEYLVLPQEVPYGSKIHHHLLHGR